MTVRQEALQDLEAHFAAIVESFDRPFDTHEFILRLAHQHQHAYIHALMAFEASPHPFMSLHGQIGKRLANRNDLVEKRGEHNSPDIFGQINSATIWRKR